MAIVKINSGNNNFRHLHTKIPGFYKGPMNGSVKGREKCGIFAVHNYRGAGNAAIITYLGLLALQHRGQESAGMAYCDQGVIKSIKGMGLVDQVFTRHDLANLSTPTMLGHVRYSTTGTSSILNAQPLVARSQRGGGIAVAHNGNLTNTRRLHNRLLDEGHIFHTTSDTEIILTYLFRFRHLGLVRAVAEAMKNIKGAFAVVAMDEQQMVAFRDPFGFRPLVIGTLGQSYIMASETAALDTVGAQFLREVAPGEIVAVGADGLSSYQAGSAAIPSLCIFEYVYFARPDSVIDGVNVHRARKAVGALLAGRAKGRPDLIVPSPDSGVSAAMGLAEALNVPLEWAVYRNPYLGRTFIKPSQDDRELAVRLKFNPIADLVRGKVIALVDDSLVRGTTARILVSLLKSAGALEVHLYIASPPYLNPCYYGIDIPVSRELASQVENPDQLAASIGAESITFAEPDDLCYAVCKDSHCFCTACFSGNYPDMTALERKVISNETFSG